MLVYDNTIDYDRLPDDGGMFVFFPHRSANPNFPSGQTMRSAIEFVLQTETRMSAPQALRTVFSWSVHNGYSIPAIWKS